MIWSQICLEDPWERKAPQAKPSKPVKTASEQKRRGTDSKLTPTADATKSKTTSASSAKTGESSEKTDTKTRCWCCCQTKRSTKAKKKFDFGEFDEDDPLAGLLSDEDDDIDPKPKPKPKKSTTPKKTGSAGISSQDSTEERPSPQEAGKQPIRSLQVYHRPLSHQNINLLTGGTKLKVELYLPLLDLQQQQQIAGGRCEIFPGYP
ncbi:hypothetical protein OS493_027822 [Desmophyllum pertusum]|uniref:Uncharacterized protein n=1 Tax=Desmophyllum pertusum TaxID=174260 RepID=A0A9W9YYL6_9CNID|nr:hypothetical protein OS493_027822 [Desmophyllum pertusum]